MPLNKMIVLAGKWDTTPMVYNYLAPHYPVIKVIMEDAVPRKTFLRKRAKKLGWFKVAGQVLFQLMIGKPLKKGSGQRINQICEEYGLEKKEIPKEIIQEVPSINHEDVIKTLQLEDPDIIIVHGTRIISQKILSATNAIILNIHAGITPRYRGSHGAYWALVNNDRENCGVTVHVVDKGIDTGGIVGQKKIPFTAKDNFSTYPYLQLAEGLVLLKSIINQLGAGEKREIQNNLDSGLWHHPTLWGYLWNRLRKGVK